MTRLVAALVVVAAGPWWAGSVPPPSASSGSGVPRDPCTILTRTQVQRLLIGKRVVRVKERRNPRNQAVECTWVSAYFQTKSLQRAHNALSLQLTAQPTATATAALDELRARAHNRTNETTTIISNLGDEAYLHLGDVIAVSGALVVQVGVRNYDTAAKPYPLVDDIARQAATLALRRLARATPLATSSPARSGSGRRGAPDVPNSPLTVGAA